MRVKISANSPLPPVRAWLPLAHASTSTISSFKSLICTSLSAFRGVPPSSLRLSIDGFELLDTSELTVVRDGDLISVDVREVPPEDVNASHATRAGPAPSRKRKRHTPTPNSSGFESDTERTSESTTSSDSESESASETSDSGSTSDSEDASAASLPRKAMPRPAMIARVRAPAPPPVELKLHRSSFVPPGYGKPQTQARNLRRRLKRMHEREATSASGGGPVSGANAVVPGEDAVVEAVADAHDIPALMSLSLRNKNKAKNFRSLMGRALPPKIIFGDQEGVSTNESETKPALPRLTPPSSRSSLPPNLFVTSVDVEAGLHGEEKRHKMRDEVDISLDYGEASEVESMAKKEWATLAKPTRETAVGGVLVGYKALGIDPTTCMPGQVLTVGRVVSCGGAGVVVRPLQAVSFSGPVEGEAEEEHAWEEIERGDWRLL